MILGGTIIGINQIKNVNTLQKWFAKQTNINKTEPDAVRLSLVLVRHGLKQLIAKI